MTHELICAWLGLPAEVWPPDHYRLLGLQPGENDPTLIEERVHQRLDEVRRYQMTHPEPATEAMNRIAQAFVCLSESAAKRVYDAALLGAAVDDPLAATQTMAAAHDPLTATVIEDREPLVLQYNPSDQASAPPIQRTAPTPPPPTKPPEAIPVAAVAEPIDPIVEAARSAAARRGLATKRQLYQRIVETRALLRLWNQAGKYLASPKRRLSRLADLNVLLRVLHDIREKLRRYPPLLGEAGQPGYLVVTLTQFSELETFQALSPTQREALSRDWEAGQKLLESYREFLRQEARIMRRRSLFQRWSSALRKSIVEQPGRVLIAIALAAIGVAIWRTYVSR